MNRIVTVLSKRRFAAGCVVVAAGALGFGALAGASGARSMGRSYPSVGLEPLPPADPATVPGYGHDPVSLLGPSRLTAAQMAESVAQRNETNLTVSIEDLAQIYVEEAAAYGVRADLAWAQSIVETGWFRFPTGGLVRDSDNNFAGMGACDSCADGNRYADARTGVRAQMAALRGYADPVEVADAIHRPPASYRGSAPTWREMGHGHWATSTRYTETILSVYDRLLTDHGLTLDSDPPVLVLHAGEPAVPARPGDGLYLAGIDGQVYDVGDARFWGSAARRELRSAAVSVVPTPTVDGYWLVTAGGGVLGFGDATVDGDAVGRFAARVAAVVPTPTGTGYWIVSRAGEVLWFGDAAAVSPAPGSIAPETTIVGLAPTATGLGYWLADSAGVVYPVGDATDFGGMIRTSILDPIVAIAATPSGDGYWLLTAAGRVHAFGAAGAFGGLVDEFDAQLAAADFESIEDLRAEARRRAAQHPAVAIASTPTGAGYWIVTGDGWVVGRGDGADFGDATPEGEAVVAANARR